MFLFGFMFSPPLTSSSISADAKQSPSGSNLIILPSTSTKVFSVGLPSSSVWFYILRKEINLQKNLSSRSGTSFPTTSNVFSKVDKCLFIIKIFIQFSLNFLRSGTRLGACPNTQTVTSLVVPC